MADEVTYYSSGYRKLVRMSSYKYILVEGQNDKRCLMYLIEELFGRRDDIKIHGAYQIFSDIEVDNREKMENREKVETISEKISTVVM